MLHTGHAASWETAVRDWPQTRGHRLLRAYGDELNARLVEQWLGDLRPRRLLKTDLFDEAVGSGLFPCLEKLAEKVVAVDVSQAVTETAAARYPGLEVAVADVRDLPFADDSFDAVVSCSTLDHFETAEEVDVALREIARVLAPHGRLLVSLDNASNPLVLLRNAIPWRWLAAVRLVPCYVGKTYGWDGLESRLRAAGLDVERRATLMHVPRVAVLGVGAVSPARPSLLDRLLAGERLGRLRTRRLTAQFIAALAVKRG